MPNSSQMDEGRLLKHLSGAFVFRNAKTEDERYQLFYHMYIILKPNENRINRLTSEMLKMIEELVPDKSESNLYGEELSEKVCMTKFGFTNGRLHRLDKCDEDPATIPDVVNSTFPTNLRTDRISPDTDCSSGIESDIFDEEKRQKIDNLPTQFHFMSHLKVPTSISSSEILQLCQSSKKYGNSIFDSHPTRAVLPKPPKRTECLKPKVSLIYVKNRADAMSLALKQKCLETPICVIRDLAHAVGLNLQQFTTKNIERIAQDYEMDLREQWNGSNVDGRQWFYPSYKYRTKVENYSQYQGDSFAAAIKDGYNLLKRHEVDSEESKFSWKIHAKKRKRSSQLPKKDRIYFGTNLDFSGEKFGAQVVELQKLPPFCRLSDETNFLSHLGYDLKGMNTAQFYMKIPGCRTPAHLENNSFCSVNLNIGPGDCEWFGVSYEYYPLIDEMCKAKKLDFLNDSWWPNYNELISAGIPVYRFMQKTGDIVWISGGCVHWVEAKGWCNNVAWNVGPMSAEQYKLNLLSTEFNRIRKFESLIPMQYLSWKIAKNCKIEDAEMRRLLRGVLIRSLAHNQLTLQYIKSELSVTIYPIEDQLDIETTNCYKCKTEIFNLIFANLTQGTLQDEHMSYDTYCLYCAKQIGFKNIEVWQIYKTSYLCQILDQF